MNNVLVKNRLLAALVWIIAAGCEDPTPPEQVALPPPEPYWSEELNVCNSVQQPDASEQYQSCVTLAEQGRVYAQMRLAWLYFSTRQEQHLQDAYNWLKPAGQYDDSAKLISQILLFVYGTTEAEQSRGYQGIQQLVDRGFAPAEAYMATVYFLDENIEPKTQDPNWLINKAFAKANSLVRAEDLALINMRGFGAKENKPKAKSILLESAKAFPVGTNNVAWMAATYGGPPLFEPDYAVKLAESVIADDRYAENYMYVDTLAAAYAANRQFDAAVETQTRALSLFRQQAAVTANQLENTEVDELQERLALYQAGKKAVYSPLQSEPKAFFEKIQAYIEAQLLHTLRYATAQIEHP